MTTIRQKDGVSAFPNRAESEYDTFGAVKLFYIPFSVFKPKKPVADQS